MRKEELRENFEGAIDSLIKLTEELCSNTFSGNYRYVVKPNQDSLGSHLTDAEVSFHKRLLTFKNKPLKKSETLDLLWVDDTVPVWINISVVNSTDSLTTIELMTSRRLRGKNGLNHVADQYPPFHPQVHLPPDYKNGEKFDINWASQGKKGIWTMIKGLLS
jgi:hypothetical protein